MPDDTTRRDFLKSTAGAATALGLAATCSGCALFNKKDVQLEARPDAKDALLTFEKFPRLKEPNGFVRVKAKDGDLRIIVLHTPNGPITALSMRCTHWGCDIDWDKEKTRFDCPCHGSKFDAAGNVLEGPADAPLTRYPAIETPEGVTVVFTPATG